MIMKFDEIIDPVPIYKIQEELNSKSELLFSTEKGIEIYLVKYQNCRNILDEIARLREITFRAVGEGTGKSKDTDKYDQYYDHIVLWNTKENEIIGSYRLGITKEVIKKFGYKGLYNTQSFIFNKEFDEVLDKAVEVGRSFIQEKYWRSNGLDLLWNGIGKYLMKNPSVKYMFGGVSISDVYSKEAKNLIVGYYKKWYLGDENYCSAKKELTCSDEDMIMVDQVLDSDNYKEDFRKMKKALIEQKLSVPVLYRRYSEMAEYGGAHFYAFTVNETFNDAIDSLIVVDLEKVRDNILNRYM